MMTIYSILKEGLKGEGTEKMWTITNILSKAIEEYVPEKAKDSLMNCIYYQLHGGHFDKETAEKIIPKFYYVDDQKQKHYAPYWTEEEVRAIYSTLSNKIPNYTFYDFEVALNMIKSDNCNKLRKWFPEATKDELLVKLVDETLNYLIDEDNPYGNEKVWRYLNS